MTIYLMTIYLMTIYLMTIYLMTIYDYNYLRIRLNSYLCQ